MNQIFVRFRPFCKAEVFPSSIAFSGYFKGNISNITILPVQSATTATSDVTLMWSILHIGVMYFLFSFLPSQCARSSDKSNNIKTFYLPSTNKFYSYNKRYQTKFLPTSNSSSNFLLSSFFFS